MSDIEQFYPDWLHSKVVEDDIPWDKKSSYSIKSFFEQYTLHDSHWVGIFHHVAFDNSITLAFEWDAVWLPEEQKGQVERNSNPEKEKIGGLDWPYLFIHLRDVNKVETSNFSDLNGTNRTIGGLEIEALDGKLYLVIDDVFGGQVDIIFSGEQSILAFNPNGTILSI